MALSVYDEIDRFIAKVKKKQPGLKGIVIALTYGKKITCSVLTQGDLHGQKSTICKAVKYHRKVSSQ